MGKKKQPSYRVVVMDSRSPRDGGYIDQVGLYNPRSEPKTVEIDAEKALRWMKNGAQPSQPVERLLRNLGVLEKA
jgi:small subunit ribosomal protein S16